MNVSSIARPKARSLIIAPRLPEKPKQYRTPFDADGDVVIDCTVNGCGWHAVGDRRDMGEAVRLHHRMHHSDQTGVVRLNQPRQ